jgi:hypothetical protein
MYLGDGVYVGHDGYHVWLYTDNGIEVLNRIALEPGVIHSLDLWMKKFYEGRNKD